MEKNSNNEEIFHLLNDMNFMCGKKVSLLAKPYSPKNIFKKRKKNPQSAQVLNSSLVITQICKLILDHFKICTIAGGYAAFIAQDINTYNDIDFFIPVVNGPSTKTLVKQSGKVEIIKKKCSCLTYNNIKSLLAKLRSKESSPITLQPTTFLKVIKVESSCDKVDNYLLSWKFSPGQFPDNTYDAYYICHIVTIYVEWRDEGNYTLQKFTFQLIFVTSIFITNKIHALQKKYTKIADNKLFMNFLNSIYGTYIVEFFDLWVCQKYIFYDFFYEQFILVEPIHIYSHHTKKPLKDMDLIFLRRLQTLAKMYNAVQKDLMLLYNLKMTMKPNSNIPTQQYNWFEPTYTDITHIQFKPHYLIAPLISHMLLYRNESCHKSALYKYSLRLNKYISRLQIVNIECKTNVFKLQKIVFIYIIKNINIFKLYEIYDSFK